MNADGVTKDDVKVPEDALGTEIQASFDQGKDLLVTIIAAMGEEQVSLPSPPLLVIILTDLLLRLSPSRRPLRVPTSLIFCMSSLTMRHVRPEHPSCQHGYSLSHRCCPSQSGIVSRVHPSSVTRYLLPFLARGVAVIIKSTAVLILNVHKKALEDDVEVLK